MLSTPPETIRQRSLHWLVFPDEATPGYRARKNTELSARHITSRFQRRSTAGTVINDVGVSNCWCRLCRVRRGPTVALPRDNWGNRQMGERRRTEFGSFVDFHGCSSARIVSQTHSPKFLARKGGKTRYTFLLLCSSSSDCEHNYNCNVATKQWSVVILLWFVTSPKTEPHVTSTLYWSSV